VTKATIMHLERGFVRLDINPVKGWKVRPGQHVYSSVVGLVRDLGRVIHFRSTTTMSLKALLLLRFLPLRKRRSTSGALSHHPPKIAQQLHSTFVPTTVRPPALPNSFANSLRSQLSTQLSTTVQCSSKDPSVTVYPCTTLTM
jgi:hypothetical protein